MPFSQTAGTPAPAQNSDPISEQIAKLVQTQVQSIANLAKLQGDRAELVTRVARTKDSEHQTAVRQLEQVEGQIAGERAKLTELNGRIDEIRSHQFASLPTIPDIPTPPIPPVFAGIPSDQRVFGMNKNEAAFSVTLIVLLPLVLVLSRWLWRRTGRAAPAALTDDRMARIEQAVEAVAIEVERISESQRFQSKLMAEKVAERAAVEPR